MERVRRSERVKESDCKAEVGMKDPHNSAYIHHVLLSGFDSGGSGNAAAV